MTTIGGDQQDVEINPDLSRASIGLATADIELIVEVAAVGLPGPPGPEGPPGGTLVSGYWDYDFQTTAPVASGHIRTSPDPAVVGQPMTIYLASQDDNGLYWNVDKITVGDEIRLRGSGGTVQHCIVTSFDETNPGQPQGYAIIGSILKSSTGQIAKNAKVEVSLIHQATPLMVLTQMQYDALPVKDPETVYVITA